MFSVIPIPSGWCNSQEGMIKLESGREVTLEALRQEKTYADTEGMPRTTDNNKIIEMWRRRAIQNEHQRMVLIEPIRTPGPGSPFARPSADQELGPHELLPSIVCVGLFQSTPVRNERQDCSLLHVVWFQDRFALPIDPRVVCEIQKLHWERLAYNWTL